MFSATENHDATSVIEITGYLLDIIKAWSATTTGIQSAGDVMFYAGSVPASAVGSPRLAPPAPAVGH